MYICTIEPTGFCGNKKKRVFHAFHSDMHQFDELYISSSMVWDHLPDTYVAELETIIREIDALQASEGKK